MQQYDMLIIGGGPAGYVAAIRAAQLGMKTGLVEAEALGGVCLNWGCIPTKALLRSAEIYHYMEEAESFGLKASKIDFDSQAIIARSRKIADKLSRGIGFLMKKNKVTIHSGYASFKSAQEIEVRGKDKTEKITGKHILIATGAKPRDIPGFPIDGKQIWTSKEAMIPEKMPESLLILGSGAIGVEFASFYRRFGVETTIIEILPRILSAEDAEIGDFVHKKFEKRGIKILTGVTPGKVTQTPDMVSVVITDKEGGQKKIDAEKIIVAAGVVPNVQGLGLEAAGVKIGKGGIEIDEWGQTSRKGIYAVGDVAGGPMLAHKASHEAVVCVEKIAGVKNAHPLNKGRIPGCTYCEPQIASIGLTEQKAGEAGREIKVGRFPFAGNGKAIALGAEDGFVKTIFDKKTGQLLGAHLVGAEVTELIQGFAIAMTLETTEAELMQTVFPHPTLSEMMHESVLAAYDKPLHI